MFLARFKEAEVCVRFGVGGLTAENGVPSRFRFAILALLFEGKRGITRIGRGREGDCAAPDGTGQNQHDCHKEY